ncbi:MAG TPA: hypothetical protein VFS29_07110 [Motilibacteraceae bacterium]|nr:hypothetical protein [Motilibacteraceae bacterium]
MTRAAASLLLAALALSACSARDHAAELAAAKCATPALSQASPHSQRTDVTVTELPGGQRKVTGRLVEPSGAQREYVCVVEPDESDTLRGLRIVSLTVSDAVGP